MNNRNNSSNQNIQQAIKALINACNYKIVDELNPKEVCKYFLKPSELKQCLQHGVSFYGENNRVSHKLWDLIVALDLANNVDECIDDEENEVYKFDLDF